jgi:hypothetical protein
MLYNPSILNLEGQQYCAIIILHNTAGRPWYVYQCPHSRSSPVSVPGQRIQPTRHSSLHDILSSHLHVSLLAFRQKKSVCNSYTHVPARVTALLKSSKYEAPHSYTLLQPPVRIQTFFKASCSPTLMIYYCTHLKINFFLAVKAASSGKVTDICGGA